MDLSYNALTTLPDEVFDDLTALTELQLYSNALTTLPAGVFDDLTMLTELNLNSNALTTLPDGVFDNLTALETLVLGNNRLTTLPAGVFDDLTGVRILLLGNNGLTTLRARVFDGLTALTDLSLNSNALTTLPDGVFNDLTGLANLYLRDNPGAPFAPTADALPDNGAVPTAGGDVTLDGSGSDGGPWGANVIYSWALTSPASGVTVRFDNHGSATPVVTIPALAAGVELTFTLAVSGRGIGNNARGAASATDTATLTVTATPTPAPTPVPTPTPTPVPTPTTGGSPPAVPANQRYEYDGSAIVLTWDASADAASYTVYYDDFFDSSCRLGSSGPSFCDELATDLAATNYTHTDPDASRNYYWVVACNNYGCSEINSANPAQLGGSPPVAPANQRYEYDGSAIVLTWDASADAASYTVYYDDFFDSSCRLGSSGPSFCDELATELTATSYTHTDPDTSRNYYWVVACNNYGCSEINSANPAQLGGSPPVAPANQRYEYDGSAIVLTWDAPADAASYTVYYDDFFDSSCRLGSSGPSFCDGLATELAATSYTHTDPDTSRNYYWVVACNNYGCSEIDSANPAQLGGSPPVAPANQRYEYDGSAIVLTWDASADAESYTLYYDDFFDSSCRLGSSGPSFCDELATELTATSYTHTDPDDSHNYYWVVACNNYGCSEIDSANPARSGGTAEDTTEEPPDEGAPEPVADGDLMTEAVVEGRIVARLLDDRRIEFGFQPVGGERILPSSRYFPVESVGRWLVSSPVEHNGETLGRITAQRLEDGRVEFGFIPAGGERLLPSSRYFPANARVDRWLRSSVIEFTPE